MVRPPKSRPRRGRAAAQSVGALSAALMLAVGLAAPVSAQDAGIGQLSDLQELLNLAGDDGALPSIPGSPSLPNMPGLGESGGGEQALASGIRTAADPFVPEGGFRQQYTSAPSGGTEQSTRPECAPNVFIGVPGTFEINRDDDPSKPVGLLGGFVEPLKAALGGQLSATFINYDADAGVNGTAYQRSVDGGVKKTLATAIDVSERCPGSQLFIAGFSQGAEIAGDVATEIGQRRTPVDPGRVGGVVLFSDPKRDENANLIVGTAQSQPLLPQIITGAINEALKHPSLAQVRSAIDPINDLSRIFGGGDLLPTFETFEQGPTQQRSGQNGASAGADTGTGGGLPSSGGALPEINTGGGLPEIGGASYGDDGTLNINQGLYMLPYGASGPSVVYSDYTSPSAGPDIVLVNDETTTEADSVSGEQILAHLGADLTDEEATAFADAFRSGQCEDANLLACLGNYIDNDNQLDTDDDSTADNPHAENLATDTAGIDGLHELAERCLGRGSAQACGGSHLPAGLEEATSANRPADATALVTVPIDITDGCQSSPRADNCRNTVTRIPIREVTSVPARDDVISVWETAESAAALKVMQAHSHGLPGQVAAARQALDDDSSGLAVQSGVTDLVNPGTGEAKTLNVTGDEGPQSWTFTVAADGDGDSIGAEEARALIASGWTLGRTEEDERARPRAVESYYAVAGCDTMTLQDCISAHAKGSGEPESAVPTAVLAATATHAESADGDADSGRRDQLPAAFAEECLTKTYEACASGAASRDVPSLPPVAAVTVAHETSGHQSRPSAAVSSTQQSAAPTSATSEEAAQSGDIASAAGGQGVTSSDSDEALGESEDSSAQAEPTDGETAADDGEAATAAQAEEQPQSEAAGAAPTTSQRAAAGAAPSSSQAPQAGQDATSTTATTGTASPSTSSSGATPTRQLADVEEITMPAVSGGGLSGKREADFGELIGRVASPCVPGDIVCSLPEDSQLARSLVQLGKNMAVNVNDLDSAEGATRMGGMLAVQAVDTVLQVTGLPQLKMSPETIIAVINLVAGIGLIHIGDVPAGAALISTTITQLPEAIPEVIEQLQDIPAILAGLPQAGERAAENLGLVTDRVGDAFGNAGLGNPTDLANLPAMLPGLVQAVVQDNSGLLEVVTNPMYYASGTKHEAFDTLNVAGDTNAIQWHQRWLTTLGEELAASA